MAKKEYLYLRLYRIHDPDLVLLYHNKSFGFTKAVRESLRAFANKDCPCFDTETFRQEFRQWKAKQLNNHKIMICPHCGEVIYINN